MFYPGYMVALYGFSTLRSEIVDLILRGWRPIVAAANKFSILGKNYVSFLIISEQVCLGLRTSKNDILSPK